MERQGAFLSWHSASKERVLPIFFTFPRHDQLTGFVLEPSIQSFNNGFFLSTLNFLPSGLKSGFVPKVEGFCIWYLSLSMHLKVLDSPAICLYSFVYLSVRDIPVWVLFLLPFLLANIY